MKQYIGFLSFVLFLLVAQAGFCTPPAKEIYQVKMYSLKNDTQVQKVDQFLKEVYLPALHRRGIKKVGVFKPIANDTATVKKIYVLIPYHSVTEWMQVTDALEKDADYIKGSGGFMTASATSPSYERIESTLLEAFPKQPQFSVPATKASHADRVYELRSYESPTDSLFVKKVKLFNEGGEIELFQQLGFSAVFYAKVISGAHMPNLMYMTAFESVDARNEHWKNFGGSPVWQRISAIPAYENKVSVSHIDSILMHATDYSDI